MASPPRRSLRCVRREQRGQERVELTSSRIHGKGVRGLEMSRAGIRVEVDQDVTGERKQQEWWLEQHQRVTLIIIYNSIFKENTHPSPGPNPTVVAMSVLGNINFAWAVTDEKKNTKKTTHTHTEWPGKKTAADGTMRRQQSGEDEGKHLWCGLPYLLWLRWRWGWEGVRPPGSSWGSCPRGCPLVPPGYGLPGGGGGMDVKTLSRGVNREWQGTNWSTKLGSEALFLFVITTVMLQWCYNNNFTQFTHSITHFGLKTCL